MPTYGSRDRNPFQVPKTYDLNGKPVPSNNGNTKYYTLVDSVTQEITIKSPTVGGAVVGASGDRTVGTIPKDGVFKPELGSATTTETQYFTSAQGQKNVKNHAVITAQKAGVDPQKARQLIYPNTATPGGVSGTTSTPTAAAAPGTNNDPINTNPNAAPLTYPVDIGSTKQDVIKFTLLEYQASGFGSLGTSGGQQTLELGGKRDPKRKGIGTVILPIPSGISDTNSCNWGSNELDALKAALAASAYTGITEGIGAGLSKLGASATQGTQDPTTKKAVASAFTAAAMGGDNAAILSRAEGAVINPNMELLFNGPTLRPFSFTFKMSARSDTEAKTIIKIIRFFKRGMSPIKSPTNLFLKTPNTFSIQYLYRPGGANKDHPFIGRIKECALQNFTVNYTPEGQYATYSDGVMVSYEMQMQFTELEPVFNSDYEGLDGIGY